MGIVMLSIAIIIPFRLRFPLKYGSEVGSSD